MREFIVEADGGSRGNPGPAGYGCVVRDAATGETLVETYEYLGVVTNNVAEYRGLLAGLRAAHDLDPSARVHVRMDSKLVVEQMSGRWKIKHPDMKPLALEAGRIFPPGRVTYEWIPREQNKHADRLANEAMDSGASASSVRKLSAAEPVPRLSAAESVPRLSAAEAEADVRAATAVASPGWAPADMGAPATFVLLRHGETPLTPQKRFSGSGGTDPSLSEVGREQAERAAEALARRGTIQHILASPLARTRETAAAVADRLGLEVTVEDGLIETDFGAWEGLTFGEVRERYPDDLTTWLSDPEAQPTGGGESFAATATRIAATRDKLVAAYAGRTVLLVTHVTPIKTFVRLALGAPPESLFRMELSAASMSVVAYYADGNASVRLLNDTSHLRP
ncbi:broad specificity phosphatase PhoE/ribonuclease HI [Streptomyces sp. SAI-135]|uniref:bifunctional RNase H/acid phosphatase n=1 Tax=unclassified Streptomyces TaxID=2593676 RepID=UPI002475F513|nr:MULTISPECIES: bifunctional RNase H/acid phosphatase [unclassified Streptomyces]MDH6519440.1 broad specificity phosphatase PhoE/ribonuclease HI [Streptomyces sp. SAI-090]MDH6616468.1 broad specificity phosphatase PhoE/ribonuclease HI [Streptomyces sp. SAI-135]